ncbi:ABC transporter substrate-binding protein [Paenibacillus sp. GCM10027626]|uniref:ABC transporter substrate-binding protein n=1 Tax=Paenibacillus sp. GCM10027626 TaxID=3273411 RepID=UPI00363B9851
MNNGIRESRGRGKIVALLLCITLISALAAGCGNEDDKDSKDSAESDKLTRPAATDTSTETPKSTQNETKYPASLTYWVQMDSDVAASLKNFGEAGMYQELEKITGTKVEFQHPAGEAAEQINLLLATNKLPDVIYYTWNSVAKGPDNAIKDKSIIRLNELIESDAPNFSQYLKDNPEIKKEITTDDGNIYVMPKIDLNDWTLVNSGPIIRKDWLEKLGLPLPETIDDWYKTLKAFKEQDPNGNGKADEIPLLPEYMSAWASAWNVGNYFYQKDGVVKFGPVEPEFKQFVTTMAKWYQEGLIDQDYAATDTKLRDAKMSTNTLGAFVGYVGSGLGKYLDLVKPTNPDFDLAGAPFPVANAGDTNHFGMKSSPFIGQGAAISGANKNPAETMKWLDFGFSQQGHMLYNFGVEGKSYVMENGKAKFTDFIMNNPDKLTKTQALGNVTPGYGPYSYDQDAMRQLSDREQQNKAREEWAKADGTYVLPAITLKAEEDMEFANIMNDIDTFYGEKFNKFIMGTEPLANFDNFVETIKGMGIDKAIQIQQAALDRYNNRK